MRGGFIALHRSILDWQWYRDGHTCRVFIHLLLTANHAPADWKGFTIGRGQALTSRRSLCRELGISEQCVRTALTHLQKTGEITLRSTSHYSLVTLLNYDKYQIPPNAANPRTNPPSTHDQPTANPQLTTNNNKNNVNKEDKDNKDALPAPTEGHCRAEAPSGDAVPPPPVKQPGQLRKSYAEFVTMTDEEYRYLEDRFGQTKTRGVIEILDNYKGSTGKRYKSDLRAILSWVSDRYDQGCLGSRPAPALHFSGEREYTDEELRSRLSDMNEV